MIFTKTTKTTAASSIPALDRVGVFGAGGPKSENALKISTVSACMEIISNSIAMLPQYVMNEGTKEHIEDHYLGKVLWQRPNEIMSPKDFKQSIVASMLAHGNAYVWNYRDNAGHVVERIPIPHHLCAPAFDIRTGRWMYHATDPRTGQVFVMDPADISHYKAFSMDGIHGIGVLERARRTIENAAHMEDYATSVYKNGGRPSGALTVDTDLGNKMVEVTGADGKKENITKKEYIRREWDSHYSGPSNAFRTAILDLGLKYEPIAMSNADQQFIEQKNCTAEDICRFFLVPPYKCGLGDQSYNSNEQNNIEFAVQTLQPPITAMEQEDSWKLLTLSEQNKGRLCVKMNMAALLRGDAKTRAEVEEIYRNSGVYSVNDINDLEDRPHVPGGDTRYASLNYIPLEFFEMLSMSRNAPGKTSEGGEE